MIRHNFSAFQKLTVFLLSFAMFSPVLAFPGGPQPGAKPLTEDQKILHVLNRLGFGARPGDVEKVKAMGLQKYIDQQLNPASIDDSVAEAKVKNLEIFNMSTAELFEKYPNPGALLRQLEGGKKAQAAKTQNQDQAPANGDKAADANAPQANDTADATKDAQKERREKLQELYREYDLRPAGQLVPQIVANRVLRDVYSERQLQQVMVDFWANHFNVFAGKAAVKWYIPSYERDVIRPNALGNFKDLLVGTAEHPAMLYYLDNFQSISPNSQTQQNARAGNDQFRERLLRNGGVLPPQMRERIKMRQGITDEELDRRIARAVQSPQAPKKKAAKRGLNENYARELMELHTLGVNGGYTQKDVIEVAKCFTGWTIADPSGYRRAAANMIKGTDDVRFERQQRQAGVPEGIDSGQFYFNPRWHESGPKYVLGQKIDEGGMKDGLKVLDILVNSPATAKFIARELAVKFVSDNPSDALVTHVADAFHRSGGDIKTTLRALFSDPEFFAPENYHAKIKTPFELVVSSIRTLGADTNGSPALVAMLRKLGEVPYGYQAPTGYPDKAEDWVNTGALLERLNFAVAIASNRIPGTRVNLNSFAGKDKPEILNNAIAGILDGEVSPATKGMLLKQLEQPLPEVKPGEQTDEMEQVSMPAANGKRGAGRQGRLLQPSGNPDIFKAVSLVLGTPEFQRQ